MNIKITIPYIYSCLKKYRYSLIFWREQLKRTFLRWRSKAFFRDRNRNDRGSVHAQNCEFFPSLTHVDSGNRDELRIWKKERRSMSFIYSLRSSEAFQHPHTLPHSCPLSNRISECLEWRLDWLFESFYSTKEALLSTSECSNM